LSFKLKSPIFERMAIREILEVPDPRLKIVSEPVERFDESLKALVDDMFETMYAASGIGLAAIQVGEPLRLLVIDLQEPDLDAEPEACHGHHDHGDGEPHMHYPVKNDPRVFVNPEILDPAAELTTFQEGCLSVPEVFADVDRPKSCRVRWQDLEGNVHEEAMEGMIATVIQHEMDHLNGILFIDHLSRLKRNMALRKLEKIRKAA